MFLVRCIIIVVSVVLGTTVATSESRAWEFSMQGAFNYIYEYYGQQGKQGFFGPFDVDRSQGTAGTLGLKSGDFASVNAWVGHQIGRSGNDLSSGADAVKHYQNLELWPELRMNPVVRFRAKYRVGAFGDPYNSDYLTNTAPGTDVATSDGQWTMWWLTARIPWGIIGVGKRPQMFGTGLQFDGKHNSTTEGVGIFTFYGPFRIVVAFRPWFIEPPNPRLKQSSYPYYNISDKNGARSFTPQCFMVYQAGALDMGIFSVFQAWHAGPESQNRQADRLTFIPFDASMQQGTLYLKFNNGRYFFNTELAYYYEQVYSINRGQNTSPPAAARGPLYVESMRYMAEFGAFAGPAKISFLYTFMPGADRRAGKPANKQPYTTQNGFGAYGVFCPYSYLLGYAYGAGVNAFDFNGNGYINEAWVLATRLDYALAANLNCFGTFLWAERSSYGHGWGYIKPAQKPAVTHTVNSAGTEAVQVKWTPYVNFQDNLNAPSIPETALGWEITAGINWKLLENYMVGVTGSYWQPGKWFNFACVDKSVPNWDVPTATNNWGTNPDRHIDPVFGGEVALQMDF